MEGVPYRSTMNKKIDKAALAARIRSLEGLSSDDKSTLLELLNEQKRYGLVWEDSPEEVEALLREKLPVLTEDITKLLLADTTDEVPNHILIEGDNYPALVALQYAYEGKVDVIYIDPPYNTGNKDFIYNDSYVDSEDSYRHSKWLSFMSKRLRIAKRLLSDRGVIFISIDDNEQANLKLLCDEVLGGSNFIGQLIIETATDNNPRQISTEHEYMLCYAKSKNIQGNWTRKSEAASLIQQQYDKLKTKSNSISVIQEKLREWIKQHKEDLPQATHYDNVDEKGVFHDGDIANTKLGGYDYVVLHPLTGKPCKVPEKGFRFPESTMRAMIANNDILFGEDETVLIKPKKRIENAKELLRSVIYEDGRAASKMVDTILHRGAFNNPKSVNILRRLLDFTTTKNSLILDFFAGSGTTLHATMQLNAEDGGQRQCILVTNNENNICEEVTYERNKRVIQGYTTPKGQQVEGLKKNNLRYYKIDFVDREKTAANQKELMKASTDLLCIKENLYHEETCFEDLKLHKQIARCFSDGVEGGKKMLIIYEPNAIPAIVKRIEQMTVGKENKLKVYVMAEGQYPYTEDFESVLSKIDLRAMPHALYQAMRQVLPPPAEAENTEPDMKVSDEEADGSIYKSEEQ